MPHPWKKTITRYVTDLRSSHHKRGSMVVQTGFPTSLVDLIVKNQDRLKKSQKNRNRLEIPDSNLASHFNSPEHVFFPNPVVSFPETKSPNRQPEAEIKNPKPEMPPLVEDKIEDCSVISKEEEDFVNLLDSDSWVIRFFTSFMIFLKLYFLVILALATKQFALGITVSAFTLLFLEFCGKYIFDFLKPCTVARKGLKSVVERGFFFVRPRKSLSKCQDSVDLEVQKEPKRTLIQEGIVTHTLHLNQGNPERVLVDEIQIAEANLDSITHTREIRWRVTGLEQKKRNLGKDQDLLDESNRARDQMGDFGGSKPNLDLLSRERRWGSESKNKKIAGNEGCLLEDAELRHRRMGSHKLKRKLLKKFLPKKYHSSKTRDISGENYEQLNRDIRETDLENFGRTREQNLIIRDNQEPAPQEVFEIEEKFEKEDERSKEHSSSDISQVEMETVLVGENMGSQTQESSGYLILMVAILVGLVYGQFIAIAVTVTWILLRKVTLAVVRIFK